MTPERNRIRAVEDIPEPYRAVGAAAGKINDSTSQVPVATESVLEPDEVEPAVFLMGAHGGSGVTTLAHTLAPMRETVMFPAADDPNLLVVVTAAHRTGLDAAHRIIRQLQAGRAGGCTLLGLMVVHTTAGKMPKPVAQRLAGVADNVHQVWEIPYIDAWRTVPTDDLPVWTPQDSLSDQGKKKNKRQDPLKVVPIDVADVGLDMCHSAVDLYKSLA